MDNLPTSEQPRFIRAGDSVVRVIEPDTSPPSLFYNISAELATFFKAQTGIEDDETLNQHILGVQARAHKVFPFKCVRSFAFLQPTITTLSVYESILQLGRERQNAIYLDVGACFGVDGRRLVADGFPVRNIVNFDLKREFFDLGHDLFKTTPASYPVNFIEGDVLDDKILGVTPSKEVPPGEVPDLSTLMSLNQLAGHCSVIYVSKFFHLFSEDRQRHLAHALAGLLSPLPGSIICGQHVSDLEKRTVHTGYGGMTFDMFCHCPQSWADLWGDEVFGKGNVKVDTELTREEHEESEEWVMRWSVVRL